MSNTSDDHSEDQQRHANILDKMRGKNKTNNVSLSSRDKRKQAASMKSDAQEVENHPEDIEISISSGHKTKDAISLKSDVQVVENNDEDMKKASPKKSSRKLLQGKNKQQHMGKSNN